jgi:predicted nucleic acid-binding protein
VLVPALLSWHPGHRESRSAILDRVSSIPAHVLVETYSVLTRLPAPHRIDPKTAAAAIGAISLNVCALPPAVHQDLVVRLADSGIRGGGVYDAVVGATALHNQLTLLTRDRRARQIYDVVGVRYSLL